MKVLLIEDDHSKAQRVAAVIGSTLHNVDIEIEGSFQSGRRRIESGEPVDFIVLDMSIPTFNPGERREGRPRPLGGYDLMRKVKRLGLRPAFVVLTALENFGPRGEQFSFEQMRTRYEDEFRETFKGAIYYSQSSNDWRDKLVQVLTEFNS